MASSSPVTLTNAAEATPLAQGITAAVARFYEAFPYPRYPLLAKPIWTDGYLASSAFAESLAHSRIPNGTASPLLVAGAGEIVSYVIRKWEPNAKTIYCVDLSARSLMRSRFRLMTTLRPSHFVQADLDEFLSQNSGLSFSHSDAYGMLHHMATPGRTLSHLATHLQPGGTVRLMVYNTPARGWLNELQRVFALLGIDPHKSDDRHRARSLIKMCGVLSPALAARIAQVGPETLENDVRFADTFLHPHELRLRPRRWLEMIEAAGLKAVGLFDRYAELDDLPNPLWQMPTSAELEERAEDGRFENNLELYLRKPGEAIGRYSQPTAAEQWRATLLSRRRPPRIWFAFNETKNMDPKLRKELWQAFLATVVARKGQAIDRLLRRSSEATFRRLARIGAILPAQLHREMSRSSLTLPMAETMTAPVLESTTTFSNTVVEEQVRRWLERQGRLTPIRLSAVLRRLARAQES